LLPVSFETKPGPAVEPVAVVWDPRLDWASAVSFLISRLPFLFRRVELHFVCPVQPLQSRRRETEDGVKGYDPIALRLSSLLASPGTLRTRRVPRGDPVYARGLTHKRVTRKP